MRKNKFPQNLRKLRKARGISQNKLSREIGFPKATIRQFEVCANGPRLESLIKIANFFGVSLDELVFGHPKFEPKRRGERNSQLIRVLRLSCLLAHSKKTKSFYAKIFRVSEKTIQRDFCLLKKSGFIVNSD